MSHTRLALAFSEKSHHILSSSEAPDVIRSYDWFSLFSHMKKIDADMLRAIIGTGSKVSLSLAPSFPIKQKGKEIVFRSPLNGETLQFSINELKQITHLFDYVILPEALIEKGIDNVDTTFFVLARGEQIRSNLLLDINTLSKEACLEKIKRFQREAKSGHLMIRGDMSLERAVQLSKNGIDYIETASPLINALKGHVDVEELLIDLREVEFADAHCPIVKSCDCYTCTHHTRAYLHHLNHHSPLLAVKLQAIHNVHFWVKSMAIQ